LATRFAFWHKKPSAGFPRRADNHARPVSLPKWPHPLAGTTLPRFGRLARASAPLLMQIQNRNFIDGSREPLSAVVGRPVHVINAVLRIRSQKFRSSASFRAGRRDGKPNGSKVSAQLAQRRLGTKDRATSILNLDSVLFLGALNFRKRRASTPFC
jgi:hypothetical protein